MGERTRALVQGLDDAAKAAGIPFSVDSEGGMFGFFLQPQLAQNYQQAVKTDTALFSKFFHGMLDRGVYFAPALYEAGFVSAAHSQADLDETFTAAREVFAQM